MSEAERAAVGLKDAVRLPGTIVDARKALVGDEEMVGMLGKEFVEKYILVNEVRFLSFEKLSGAY